MGGLRMRAVGLPMLLAVLVVTVPDGAVGDGNAGSDTMSLREEIERLKQKTGELERKLESVEEAGKQERAALETKVDEETSVKSITGAVSNYFGENRFVLSGYGFAGHQWDDRTDDNTFTAGFVPIGLFRVTDRVLFEAEVEFELEDNEVEVGLEYAQADVIITDNITFVAGKFLMPFSEFAERGHPPWINKLVSFPAPYDGPNRIVPFSELGAQLRGGIDLGAVGLLDYTVYIANGPRFETVSKEDPEEDGAEASGLAEDEDGDDEGGSSPSYGAPIAKNFDDFNGSKAYGARIGYLPLPADGNLGRLRVGASTYNGKANDSRWYYAWGVDASYRYKLLELRAEYLHGTLKLPGRDDQRDGWSVQGSYELANLLPSPFNRFEVVTRYSGANRFGDDELRKPRQVALGLDYWLTPSVAFKVEYDRDMPSGAPDSNRVLSQVAVGF